MMSAAAESSPSSPSQSPQSRVEVEEVTTIVKSPLLRPSPAFLKVIHYGGGQGETFTMGEILDYVKKYIDDKKLYDQHDPRVIYCRGNDLGAAFNVDHITIPQVLKVFLKHCTLEKDSRVRVSKQVNTRPLCDDQSTSSTSTSSSSCHSTLSSQEIFARPLETPVCLSSLSSSPSSLLPSPVVSSSTPVPSSIPSHTQTQCTSSKGQSIPAAGPSTTISNRELESSKADNSDCMPSTSFSIIPMDETDGTIPWICQVEVDQSDEEAGGHQSLVVECSSDNFSVEYELVSSSEAESFDLEDTEDSKSPSESTPATAFYLVCEESDIEYYADYSDTDSDSDAELGEEDKWECNMCQFKNSAFFRNCGKCWSLRPDWLPACSSDAEGTKETPANADRVTKEASGNSPKTSDKSNSNLNVTEIQEKINSGLVEDISGCTSPCNFQLSSQDSAIGTISCCSQDPVDCDVNSNNENGVGVDSKVDAKPGIVESSAKNKDRRKRTYSSCLSDSHEELAGKTKVNRIVQGNCGKEEEKDACPKDPCVICLTRPKTACIIHGKTGHQVCCYGCARMLKKKRKPCPICRRPIQRVVRNYF